MARQRQTEAGFDTADRESPTAFDQDQAVEVTGDAFGVPESADLSVLRKAALAWFKKNLQGTTAPSAIGEVRFSSKGGRKFTSSNPDATTLRALPSAPRVISEGDYVGSKPLNKPRKDGIVRFHRFEADIVLDGDNYRAAVLVGEDSFGNLFYDLKKTEPLGTQGDYKPSSEGSAGGKATLDQDLAFPESEINLWLAQADRPAPRGRIEFLGSGATIRLLRGADASTVLHESAHFFIEALRVAADGGAANDALQEDMSILRRFSGAPESGEIPREAHEKLARAFEAYMREGRAPSEELAGVFAKIRDWLLNVYRSVKDLDVELTDEVRGVFDRLLSVEKTRIDMPAEIRAELDAADTAVAMAQTRGKALSQAVSDRRPFGGLMTGPIGCSAPARSRCPGSSLTNARDHVTRLRRRRVLV